jgi:hypothetical protein
MPPAPKINPVRRNSRVGPLQLPAEGRKGAPPPWPLDGKPSAQIQRMWRQLWATPQAVAWQRLGWTRVVARYARVALAAEVLDKDALAEARHLEDRLGLTPKAMRTLLWEIVADEVKEHREASDVRRRIKAV